MTGPDGQVYIVRARRFVWLGHGADGGDVDLVPDELGILSIVSDIRHLRVVWRVRVWRRVGRNWPRRLAYGEEVGTRHEGVHRTRQIAENVAAGRGFTAGRLTSIRPPKPKRR